MIIPHPHIPLEVLRSSDVLFLLAAGVAYEAITRHLKFGAKRLSSSERRMKLKLRELKYETAKKRSLGPSAFVETSKLERAVLAKEKELEKEVEARTKRSEKMDRAVRNAGLILYFIIFAVYYGVPLLSVDGMHLASLNGEIDDGLTDHERAGTFTRGILFPVSVVGIGWKIACFGLERRASSVGALVVFWAAQATMGEIADTIEAWRTMR